MSLEVHQIPILTDNYVYILRDSDTGKCAAIDPGLSKPVIEFLSEKGWSLDFILNTHHHWDHTNGNKELIDYYSCQVVGSFVDAARIPGISILLKEGDLFSLGSSQAQIVDVSGHTIGHIAFWFATDFALFCGDALFSIGCGRMFEGEAAQMWNSLEKIRTFPNETRVYCTHEYTQSNCKFALSIDPKNQALLSYSQEVESKRSNHLPTIPSTLEIEKSCNPFLRAHEIPLEGLNMKPPRDPVAVFAKLRSLKDKF